MKITREQLKGIVREVMTEESEYQTFFKKALEKTGKSIPSMSDEEKKDFFNKIDSAWNAKGEKNEGNAFGAAVTKAKEEGDDEFTVDGKTYSVKESVNKISAQSGLANVSKGQTSNVEGVKVSKDMADEILNWMITSPYGKRYGSDMKKLKPSALLPIIFGSFGIEKRLPSNLKGEFKMLKDKYGKKDESVNEGLYYVGYNKGRGQGTGVFKDSYSSYKDAKKAVEKTEKKWGA